MNKELFRTVGHGGQFFFLLFFMFAGLIVAGVVSVSILSVMGTTDINALSVDMLKILQTFQAVLMFLLPALLAAYLFQEFPEQYLTVRSSVSLLQVVAVIAVIIAVQPFINWVGFYNSQMTFPSALVGLENYLKETEVAAAKLTDHFLSDNSFSGFLSALAVVALLAALCEEFFFRGLVLQILTKLFRNIHVAVWVSAIVFSAIHFQFYGFVPRMLLGALLGYIFVWTGSIWLAILAHFLNNAFAIVLHYFSLGTSRYEEFQQFGIRETSGYALGGFLVAIVFVYFLYKTRKKISE